MNKRAKKTMKHARYILIALGSLAALTGCLGDKSAVCPDRPVAGATTITMALPRTAPAATRSKLTDFIQLFEETTSTVSELDLLFINGGNIDYRITIDKDQLTRTGDYVAFKVDLEDVYRHGCKITLLANSHEFVNRAFEGNGQSEGDFMGKLHNIYDNSSDVEVDFLTMWGETGDLGDLGGRNIPTIQMIRSLSLGIVAVDSSLDDIFVMEKQTLVNAIEKHLIAPWNGSNGYNYSHAERKVTGVSLPAGWEDSYRDGGAFYHNMQEYPGLFSIGFTDQENTSSERELAIVIGGWYGPPNTDADAVDYPNKNRTYGYYKVLMRDADGNRMDILRNHCYIINVSDIDGPGYKSWEEAAQSHSYVQAQVVEWNDAPQNVIFDGQFYLEVSHPRLDLFKEKGLGMTLTFKTNFPGLDPNEMPTQEEYFTPGVIWEWVDGDPGWITCNTLAMGHEVCTLTDFKWTENNTGWPRSTAILVQAANMKYTINITQSTESWLTADFTAVPPDGLLHKVPVSSTLDWKNSTADGTYEGGYGFNILSGSSAESRDGVYFRAPDNLTEDYRIIKMIFSDLSGYNHANIESELYIGPVRGEANCYIVKPNNGEIMFPVSIANKTSLGELIAKNDDLSCEIIWSDGQGITDESNIAGLQTHGKGSSTYILFKSGPLVGNAVIAVTSPRKAHESGIPGEDVVRWSWHIWVTDYDPDATAQTFMSEMGIGVTTMDRNLGALRGEPGTTVDEFRQMRGLYYQWGRKDAFPLDNEIYGNNRTVSIDIGDIGTDSKSSIMYPLRPSRASNWNGFGGDAKAWGEYQQKSVHDPCPEGWKVPYYCYWGLTDTTGNTANKTVLSYMGTIGNISGSPTSWWLHMNSYGGYFPGQDTRSGYSFESLINSDFSYIHTAFINSDYQKKIPFGFINDLNNDSNYGWAYNGMPVRCVKEGVAPPVS